MLYVDVILPLSVPQFYTYSVPIESEQIVQIGKRVVVQFGKSRLYTALIRRIHSETPEIYLAKNIEYVLDDYPIVHEHQLKIWDWISDYYLCFPGEVMLAALPSAYKLVSETKILLCSDEINWDNLSDHEFLIIEALQIQSVLSIEEISNIVGIPKIHPIVKSLLDKGYVDLEEEVKENIALKKKNLSN